MTRNVSTIGNRVVNGDEGKVTDVGGSVNQISVMFPGNQTAVGCLISALSRTAPPAIAGAAAAGAVAVAAGAAGAAGGGAAAAEGGAALTAAATNENEAITEKDAVAQLTALRAADSPPLGALGEAGAADAAHTVPPKRPTAMQLETELRDKLQDFRDEANALEKHTTANTSEYLLKVVRLHSANPAFVVLVVVKFLPRPVAIVARR